MKHKGIIEIELKYKLKGLEVLPDDDGEIDEDYSEQEIRNYLDENLSTELDTISIEIKKVRIPK